MATGRKTSTRTCCACGAKGAKASLVRVVRGPQGDVSVDEGGRRPGRGAYLCADSACFAKARKSRKLDRALRASIDEEGYTGLEAEFRRVVAARASAEGAGE